MTERPRTVCGIQARLSSSRLPGKVLADLAGAPLVQRVFERVRAAERVDAVYVLTSDEPSDDALVEELDRRGIPSRRGPLTDVLARYAALADELEPRWIVRVTGDCPFVDPAFVDLQLEALAAFDGDLVRIAGGDEGLEGVLGGQAALSVRALRGALASDDPRDREHAGSFWLRRHMHELRVVELEVDEGLRRKGLRLSVDEEPDLELARRVWAHHALDGEALFPLRRVLEWLDEHPEARSASELVVESLDNRSLRGTSPAGDVRPVGRWPGGARTGGGA